MLAENTYTQDYIDSCRALMDTQLTAYDKLAAKAAAATIDAFEPPYFNSLVLAMDRCFNHRTHAVEGKDGNALNEVRMFCTSILTNGGVLAAESTIKYKAETSVLKYEIGDPIRLDRAQFGSLCDAFFEELQRRFT